MSGDIPSSANARLPFLRHFVLILIAASVAHGATAMAFGGELPSSVVIQIAGFLGGGTGVALISLLLFYLTWKGGVGRHPIGAAWGAAALIIFFATYGRLQ